MASNQFNSNSLWAASSLTNPSAFHLGGNTGGTSGSSASIDSLTLTAQSMGLTLEQLALALSKSSSLKTLADDYTTGGQNSGRRSAQHDLAMSLFHNETLALYRRCMLLAGFDPSATEETSPEYLQFAFKAWQEEGKRLQDMMGPEGAALDVQHQQQNDTGNVQLQHLQQQQLLLQNPSLRSLYNSSGSGADDLAKLQLYGLNSMMLNNPSL